MNVRSNLHLLGLDLGGLNNFGWANLSIDESGTPIELKTGVSSSATDALNQACRMSDIAPIGIGIDSPLFWVTEGDRRADQHIRGLVRAAGGHSSTVAHVNSLRGACLVQGVLAAYLAASSWPSATITEAHPKALLLTHTIACEFLSKIKKMYPDNIYSEHERDATLAAFTAWAATKKLAGWRNLLLDEADNIFFPSGHSVSYWYPDE